MRIPLIVAHRAGNSYENIENAALHGADVVELDVRMTKDEVLVASHSPYINVNGFELNIGETTFNCLNENLINSNQETLLQLNTILYLARERGLKLLIDIKNGPKEFYQHIHIKAADILSSHNMHENAMVISFDQDIICELKKLDKFPCKAGIIMNNIKNINNVLERTGANLVEIPNVYLTREVVSAMHNLKAEVISWSTDDSIEIEKLARLSVDLITTENPQIAKRVLMKIKKIN